MRPSQVGGKGHDKDRSWLGGEILIPFALPGADPENSGLPQGQGHNGAARNQVLGAVAVLADVVAEATVVPGHQNAIEAIINGVLRPVPEGGNCLWHWLS